MSKINICNEDIELLEKIIGREIDSKTDLEDVLSNKVLSFLYQSYRSFNVLTDIEKLRKENKLLRSLAYNAVTSMICKDYDGNSFEDVCDYLGFRANELAELDVITEKDLEELEY